MALPVFLPMTKHYRDNPRQETNLSVQGLQASSHYLLLTEQLAFVAAWGRFASTWDPFASGLGFSPLRR